MQDLSLQPLIRQYVSLKSTTSSKGWHTCKCKVCNDYKVRAGFAFNGNETTYHCFNCNHIAKHNPDQYISISDNMQIVLDAFAVPDEDYKQLALQALRNQFEHGSKGKPQEIVSDPDTKLVEIELPSFFIPLSEATDTWAIIAKEYLQHDRSIDSESYPFMIMTDKKQHKDIEFKWRGRLIIPYYRQNKLIWYQGRDLRPTSKMRYLNAKTTSECILSSYDLINNDTDLPLYVCEGFFDSHCIGGIAIFGNTFKIGQIKMLQKTRRPIVYIPDTKGDGHIAANQALSKGWSVSIPDIGSCKDINEAICKYGKLYVLKSIKDNVLTGDFAKIAINTLCIKSKFTK